MKTNFKKDGKPAAIDTTYLVSKVQRTLNQLRIPGQSKRKGKRPKGARFKGVKIALK